LAFAQGLEAGGVLPVVKHFPGEGSATANTDDAPANTPPLATLEGADLLPFEAAIRAGLPAVMVGNASVPGLSSTPASLSPAVIDGLLRQRLGFQGLVLTDSLSAAVQAIEAGADMVLFTADDPNATTQSVVAAIVAAVTAGGLSVPQLDSAVSHVLMAKGVSLC
jgi:beta-N-acetylhexosaminidase